MQEKNRITTVNVATTGIQISYVANEFYGGYDGAWHTIDVQVAYPATGVQIFYSDNAQTGWVLNTVENLTTFKDVGTYTVFFMITAEGFEPVIGSSKVTILKQVVYIQELPQVTGLTVSSSDGNSYQTTLANATITGGVAMYSGFEIAGHFEWVTPTTKTATSVGYYYYDMKFVPEDLENFEEFKFSYLAYVSGFDALFCYYRRKSSVFCYFNTFYHWYDRIYEDGKNQ